MKLEFMKLKLCVQWNSLSLNSSSTVSKNCFHRLSLPLSFPKASFSHRKTHSPSLLHQLSLHSAHPPCLTVLHQKPVSALSWTKWSSHQIKAELKVVCIKQEPGDLHIWSCWSVLTSTGTKPLSQLFRTFV